MPTRRKGLGKGKGKGYSNITGRDPKVHSDSRKGMKQPQQVNSIHERIVEHRQSFKRDLDDIKVENLNKLAPDKRDMEKSGSQSATSDIDTLAEDIKNELKEGYAHSYEIERMSPDSVNKYIVTFYKKPSRFSFYWKRAGDDNYRNSDEETAEHFLISFRSAKLEPAFTYPVSSVERNMFLSHIQEAVDIAKPNDKDTIMKKAEKMISMSPYTNRGD